MTVPTTIDAAAWLSKHLEGDDGDVDLARAMLAAFAETLMSAQASMLCEAGYNERSEERVNSRNGYRQRPWNTRVGTIDLAVPKLREGTYYPDWLLVPRRRAGAPATVAFRLLDYYDADRGISAMMRTTGYSLSITGQMLVDGRIAQHGVHPAYAVTPYDAYVMELRGRGISIEEIDE